MGTRPSSSRGQHFLKSRRLASELVREANFDRSILVVEIGAGKGRFTEILASVAERVLALEVDRQLAPLLIERFRDRQEVVVVVGDALSFPLPAEPFRVFGNIPFNITTDLFRRLLDNPASALQRTDVIVQFGVSIKRTTRRPSNMLNLSWGPWWRFESSRRIRAASFEPRPSVDSAMLSITRRTQPLLDPTRHDQYISLLRQGFTGGGRLQVSLRSILSPKQLARMSKEFDFAIDSRGTDLSLAQWVALFKDLT